MGDAADKAWAVPLTALYMLSRGGSSHVTVEEGPARVVFAGVWEPQSLSALVLYNGLISLGLPQFPYSTTTLLAPP